MRYLIIREIAQPLIRRTGSLVAGALVSYGVQAETVNTIEAGILAILAVGLDLTMSHLNRKG